MEIKMWKSIRVRTVAGIHGNMWGTVYRPGKGYASCQPPFFVSFALIFFILETDNI